MIFDLKNQREDINYTAQIAMTKWGMSPDVFDRQNYYRLLTVMSAKDAKDRVQDPASIVPTNALGQAPKGVLSLDEFAKIKQKGGK